LREKFPNSLSNHSSSKIFIGGLSGTTSEKELNHYFIQFGKIREITIMREKDSCKPLLCKIEVVALGLSFSTTLRLRMKFWTNTCILLMAKK